MPTFVAKGMHCEYVSITNKDNKATCNYNTCTEKLTLTFIKKYTAMSNLEFLSILFESAVAWK